MGRTPAVVSINAIEREELEGYTRRFTSAQALAKRSRIILFLADGMPGKEVAKRMGTSQQTVCHWRQRFLDARMEGISDSPRSGRPRTIEDKQVEAVVTATLESKPINATHWSTRGMSAQVGLSQSSISRIWKAFNLQPHRVDSFKLSTDPNFIAKVRDVVGLYLNPPEKALVLCVDEKSQIQALDRTQTVLPMQPGRIELQTHDYERHGVTSLFAALDVATGHVIGECHARHRSKEFISFLGRIEREVPKDLNVHVILDNYATHKTSAVQRWLEKRPRFTFHFIPTSSSWLNQVERWFSLITGRMLKRGVHRSVKELVNAIKTYLDTNNKAPKPFSWTKSADDILSSIERFCLKTLQAHRPEIIKDISGSGH